MVKMSELIPPPPEESPSSTPPLQQQDQDDTGVIKTKDFKKNILGAAPAIKQKRSETDNKQAIGTENLENHPSWLELFFDLAIVLACGILVHDFSLNLTQQNGWFPPFLYIFRLIPIINLWSSLDQYYNRFGQIESLADTILALCLFIVVTCISQNITVSALRYDADHIEGAYLWTLNEINALLAIGHFVMLCFYLRVAVLVSEASWFVMSYCYYHAVMIFMWLILLPFEQYFWFSFVWMCITSVLEFEKLSILLGLSELLKYLYPKDYTYIPLNAVLMTERMGLLVIVALGEIIASVFASNLKVDSYGTTILIVCQGFLMKFAYFDVFDVPGERAKIHALRRNKLMGLMHYRLNFIVIAAILSSSMYLISASHEDVLDNGHRRKLIDLLADDHGAGDDHGDDHGGGHGDDHGVAASLTDDESYTRIRYRQIVYAFSCVVVLLSCYFLGLTNKRYPYLQRKQLVPRYLRTLFMLCASTIMLIAGAVVDYDDRLSLIGIELSIFAFCLFVEFMCKWFILRPREVKTLDDSTSDHSYIENERETEGDEYIYSDLIVRRTQVRRRSSARDIPPADFDSHSLEMQDLEKGKAGKSLNPLHGDSPLNGAADEEESKASVVPVPKNKQDNSQRKVRRKSSLLALAGMSYQLPTAEMLRAGDTSKNSNRRLQKQLNDRASEASNRFSENSAIDGTGGADDDSLVRYSVI